MSDTPKDTSEKTPATEPGLQWEQPLVFCPSCRHDTRWNVDSSGGWCVSCGHRVSKADPVQKEPETTPKKYVGKTLAEQDVGSARTFFDDAEIDKIARGALEIRPHTPEEIADLFHWAIMTRLNNTLLEMVLDGRATAQWSPDGVRFLPSSNSPPSQESTPEVNAPKSPGEVAKQIAKVLFTVGGPPPNPRATHLCLFDGGHCDGK